MLERNRRFSIYFRSCMYYRTSAVLYLILYLWKRKFMYTTRLPSNLRPTTRVGVHLITRGHFRSREKDDRHTVRSAIAINSMLYANVMAVCFIEAELPVWTTRVLHARIRIFVFFAPVALTFTR